VLKRDFSKMKRKIISLSTFMKKQIRGGTFYRYDLMVRYLFIKRYYSEGQSDKFRYKLYSKFCKKRKVDERSDKFISIINSFEKDGFSEDYEPYMIMNNDYRMCGGNHRTACCLWFGICEIPVYIPIKFYDACKKKKRCWDKKWLISHGLKNYIPQLEKVREKIFKQLGI